MQTQIILVLATLLAFAVLGFFFYMSIKKYDAKPKGKKGKKARLPQYKKPGK